MKFSINQKLILISFIFLVSVLITGFAILKSIQKLLESEHWVEHTEMVIAESANIFSNAKDIETASRGYIITRDSTFLEPKYLAEKTSFQMIEKLKQLTLDNLIQQQRVDLLGTYMKKRIYYSNRAIEIRNNQGLASAVAYISSKQGKEVADLIRRITNDIQQQETALLKKRKQVNQNSIENLNLFSMTMFGLMILFTLLLFIITRNNLIQNSEKGMRAAELIIANKELSFQNLEKEKKALELIIANKELSFQNNEKEKRAAELVIANDELFFQNEEKEKRAAELIIANKELFFQNNEKENRAAELNIANKELFFQNTEKEKRAAELIIANTELSFQNKEKEKRAAELILANQELLFQNAEKEKRAAELIIANKELFFQNEEKLKRATELNFANEELKTAEYDIRKLNEELEQKVIDRTTLLETAIKELESFSYSVSHDLRAPIRAINGYAKILEEDYAEKFEPEVTNILHTILHNSKRMGNLIDDLLAFSKLGRKQVSISKIDMSALVKGVLEDVLTEDNLTQKEINVQALLPAKGDPSLIKQVWINLISNAIKYSKNKSITTIEIGSYEKGALNIYYIKDNGAGFDMRYYDKLFGVFQRLHSQEEFEGTGIGLAIVQRIVQRHSGTVWAESRLNEGTHFYFSLPNINT
jgi:signal transduction histidine kinase/CHASE3 domain sensor protein